MDYWKSPEYRARPTSLPTLCYSQRRGRELSEGDGVYWTWGKLVSESPSYWMGIPETQSSPQYRCFSRWQVEKEDVKLRKSKFPHMGHLRLTLQCPT